MTLMFCINLKVEKGRSHIESKATPATNFDEEEKGEREKRRLGGRKRVDTLMFFKIFIKGENYLALMHGVLQHAIFLPSEEFRSKGVSKPSIVFQTCLRHSVNLLPCARQTVAAAAGDRGGVLHLHHPSRPADHLRQGRPRTSLPLPGQSWGTTPIVELSKKE